MERVNVVFITFFKSNYSRSWNLYAAAVKSLGHQVHLVKFESGEIPAVFQIKRKLREFDRKLDIFIVMNPSHVLVIPLKSLGFKRVILDAGWPLFEGTLGRNHKIDLKRALIYFLDFLSCLMSYKILVESEAQAKNLSKNYFVTKRKLRVIYTGFDEDQEIGDFKKVKKQPQDEFKVFFRGLYTPLVGLEIIAEATKLLEKENIKFYVFSPGAPISLSFGAKTYVGREYIEDFQTIKEVLITCDLALGFFSQNPRIQRTIPHKTFEAMFYSIPFLTESSEAVSEILEDGKSCFFIANPSAASLANAIKKISRSRRKADSVGKNSHYAYQRKASQVINGNKLKLIIREVLAN